MLSRGSETDPASHAFSPKSCRIYVVSKFTLGPSFGGCHSTGGAARSLVQSITQACHGARFVTRCLCFAPKVCPSQGRLNTPELPEPARDFEGGETLPVLRYLLTSQFTPRLG